MEQPRRLYGHRAVQAQPNLLGWGLGVVAETANATDAVPPIPRHSTNTVSPHPPLVECWHRTKGNNVRVDPRYSVSVWLVPCTVGLMSARCWRWRPAGDYVYHSVLGETYDYRNHNL